MANKKNQEELPIVVFDDTSKESIIQSLGFSLNEESELVDENGKVITARDFEPIKLNDFGGILRSSKIPIRKDVAELSRYFLEKND